MRKWWIVILSLGALLGTAGAYPPSKATVALVGGTPTACATSSFQVSGFDPGEGVFVTLGVAEVTITADSTGAGAGTLPAPNVVGSALLQAVGLTSGRAASSTVDLIACATDPAVPASTIPSSTTAARPLPVSGSSVSGPIRIAILLVSCGTIAAVMFGRRRHAY